MPATGGFLTFVSRRKASEHGSRGVRMLSKNEKEKIGGYFADAARQAKLVKTQAIAKGWVQRRRFRDMVKKAKKRVNVLDEILKTEEAFNSSLNM